MAYLSWRTKLCSSLSPGQQRATDGRKTYKENILMYFHKGFGYTRTFLKSFKFSKILHFQNKKWISLTTQMFHNTSKISITKSFKIFQRLFLHQLLQKMLSSIQIPAFYRFSCNCMIHRILQKLIENHYFLIATNFTVQSRCLVFSFFLPSALF